MLSLLNILENRNRNITFTKVFALYKFYVWPTDQIKLFFPKEKYKM